MSDFGEIYVTSRDCFIREMDEFLLQDEYLFRFRKLRISLTSLMEFLFWEMHARDMAGHFGQSKTIEAVEHRFYWSCLKSEVAKIVGQCRTCQLAKQQKQFVGHYTHFSVPSCLWQEVSLDFILELSKRRKSMTILVVIVIFSKIAHFIPCFKTSDAS